MEKIVAFLSEVENLKSTLRWCHTSTGRQESTAEHSYRLVLMVWLVGQKLDMPSEDILKAMKMALVHDLPETYLSVDFNQADIVAGKLTEDDKKAQELRDMKKLVSYLPTNMEAELLALWQEYEAAETPIAQFVKALDKQETMLQVAATAQPYWSTDEAALDRTAIYGNKNLALVPALRELGVIVKAKLKDIYVRHNWPWKTSYDV